MPHGVLQATPRLAGIPANRFLAALLPEDFALLMPHLRAVPLERGAVLHEAGDEIEHVYFPQRGMISLVTVMRNGATVETMTVGRAGVVGAMVGLGSHRVPGKAVVQLPGTATRLSAPYFQGAVRQSGTLRDLVVRYNDLMIAEIQQSVACNALHSLEARLCRWLLQSLDCVDNDTVPLTQELLAQMLGVRRTSVTLAARLLQSEGMIRYRRGLVQIISREALEERACECYAAIRQDIEQLYRCA